ncbi:MAG TPA: hypothetical protein PLQ11_06820 [Beijerinckiaceae bacterium]|nr:hypothetical protein [Beijerinckiaceae bacterium]
MLSKLSPTLGIAWPRRPAGRLSRAMLLVIAGGLAAAIWLAVGSWSPKLPALSALKDPSHASLPANRGLSGEAVTRRLMQAGYLDVHDVRRRGAVYLARARISDRQGVRLVVHAQSGEVLGLKTVIERGSGGPQRAAEVLAGP